MKITSVKDYKKPLYAIGMSAVIMAVTLTGCHNPVKEEVQLGGAAELREDEQETEESITPVTITAGIVSVDTGDED